MITRDKGDTLGKGWCFACQKEIQPIGVEYSYDSKNHYDGLSEYLCPSCGRREGRWTGKVLGDGESEPPYGKAEAL